MHEIFGAGALSAKLLCKHSQVTFMRNILKINVQHRTSNVEHRIMMSLRSAILFHLFSNIHVKP